MQDRIQAVASDPSSAPDAAAFALKLEAVGGCFHREHSPFAYGLIDQHLAAVPSGEREFRFEEHESGPEILLWLATATAGMGLAKSVIDLVIAIISARAQGVRHGDNRSTAIELVMRRIDEKGIKKEERILRFGTGDNPDRAVIEQRILDAAHRLTVSQEVGQRSASKKSKRMPRKARKKKRST